MARSIQQIYQGMIDSKKTLLPELTNNRPTGVWNRMAYIFAIATNLLEQLFDQYQQDLIDITNQAAYGSKSWLIRKAYEFQYSANDPQVIAWVPANYRYEYPQIVDSYKIVTQASVQIVTGNQVRVKVAKGQIGSLTKLDTQEYASMQSYFTTICPAGQYIDLVSETGDSITVTLDVYFEGQYPTSYIDTVVKTAITNYLNGIAFDGTVYASSIVDAAQSVGGIINCILVGNGGLAGNAQNNFIDIPWTTSVPLYAGYAGTINITLNLYPQ